MAINRERIPNAGSSPLAVMAARVFATGLADERAIDDLIARIQSILRSMPPLTDFAFPGALNSFYGGLGELGDFAVLASEGLKRCNQLSALSRLWFACERLTWAALDELAAARGGVVVSPAFMHLYGDAEAALECVVRSAGAREISALFIVESAQLAVGDIEVSALGGARELVLGPLSSFRVIGVQRGAPRVGASGARWFIFER